MLKNTKKTEGLERSQKDNSNKKALKDLEDELVSEKAAISTNKQVSREEDVNDYGNIFAIWEFPEFIKHQRGKLWYVSFIIVFLAMLIYAYFSDNLFDVEIYPNPVSENLFVIVNAKSSAMYKILVYDLLGNIIESKFNIKIVEGLNQINFNTNSMDNGVYYLVLSSENYSLMRMVLIRR